MSLKPIIREKHRKVLKNMVENVGMSRTEAMLKENYSEAYALNGNIGQTDSWQQLVKGYLPDTLLLKKHKEGLEATRIHTSHTEPDKVIADYATRHKYLETGYKIKGKLRDTPEGNKTLIINISSSNAKRFGLAQNAGEGGE